MKQRSVFVIALIVFNAFILNAQRELAVGAKAPQITFEHSFPNGYKIPENKPILLDFWATWCSPCVAGLIEWNVNVGRFSDNVEFVAITDNSSKNVDSFIKSKGLSQHFVMDSLGSSMKRFGVNRLPYAFLIDKNNIIQWGGHASTLTPEMLDEFLRTGTIKPMKVVSTISIQKESGLSNKEMKLTITEKAISLGSPINFRLRSDTFKIMVDRFPLNAVISRLTDPQFGYQPGRLIKNISSQTLNKPISISFSNTNVNVQETKDFILKSIGDAYSFTVSKQLLDTLIWEISITDSSKLEANKTYLTGRDGKSRGGSSFKNDSVMKFTAINFTVYELANVIERTYNVICETKELRNTGYDFIKVDNLDYDKARKEFLEKYGLAFVSKRSKIEFLVLEGRK